MYQVKVNISDIFIHFYFRAIFSASDTLDQTFFKFDSKDYMEPFLFRSPRLIN